MEIKRIYEGQQKLINGIDHIVPKQNEVKTENATSTGKVSFSDFLAEQIKQVNSDATIADKAIQKAAAGEDVNPHTVLLALQKADISFTLLMNVKERLTQAYQEIMRMPIG